MLSDMRKIASREFQKSFGKVNDQIDLGQSVQITKHGKPIGVYTKARPRRVKLPNFVDFLKGDPKRGDKLLKEFYSYEGLS